MSYNLQLKNHYYIITGGPGSGKSTLLEALAIRGYKTVAEVGRNIILEELASGGNALHSGDRVAFREKMLAYSVRDYLAQSSADDLPVFFDRGIPDLIGYSYLIEEPIPQNLLEATHTLRYNPVVFIAPPWEAIYQQDSERKQDFEEAQKTYQALEKGYLENDYQLQVLPKASVAERVIFILNAITKPIS